MVFPSDASVENEPPDDAPGPKHKEQKRYTTPQTIPVLVAWSHTLPARCLCFFWWFTARTTQQKQELDHLDLIFFRIWDDLGNPSFVIVEVTWSHMPCQNSKTVTRFSRIATAMVPWAGDPISIQSQGHQQNTVVMNGRSWLRSTKNHKRNPQQDTTRQY